MSIDRSTRQRARFIGLLLILSCGARTACAAESYQIPVNGLIGYWPGAGTARDLSLLANHGSFNGSFAAGITGASAFNLATAKVVIPDIAAYDFRPLDGWSVGFWFNENGTTLSAGNGLFLGQDNGSGFRPKWFVDYAYNVYGNNSSFNFHVNDFNQERIFIVSEPVSPAPTGWHQLTVTIDNVRNGLVSFYLDGQPKGTGEMGNYVLQPTAPLVFGQAEALNYSGLLSEVVIYDRVLTASEITQLATVQTASTFSITRVAIEGGNVAITWESVVGRSYRVMLASDLASPATWTATGTPVLATTIETTAIVPIEGTAKFFAISTP